MKAKPLRHSPLGIVVRIRAAYLSYKKMLLYERPTDPLVYAGASISLLVVVLAATYLPARRYLLGAFSDAVIGILATAAKVEAERLSCWVRSGPV